MTDMKMIQDIVKAYGPSGREDIVTEVLKSYVEPQSTEAYRYRGVAQLMSDGTFQFVPRPSSPKRTRLIKKLAHGRLTETPEGVVRLTLSASRDEGLELRNAFIGEVIDAFNGRWMEEEPA